MDVIRKLVSKQLPVSTSGRYGATLTFIWVHFFFCLGANINGYLLCHRAWFHKSVIILTLHVSK